MYKGKYKEGKDKADPTMWKTRLRCALNKSTDFQEVPERNQLDITEPYKVYRIQRDNGLARTAGKAKKKGSFPMLLLFFNWKKVNGSHKTEQDSKRCMLSEVFKRLCTA